MEGDMHLEAISFQEIPNIAHELRPPLVTTEDLAKSLTGIPLFFKDPSGQPLYVVMFHDRTFIFQGYKPADDGSMTLRSIFYRLVLDEPEQALADLAFQVGRQIGEVEGLDLAASRIDRMIRGKDPLKVE